MIPILYLFIVWIGVAFVWEKMNNFAKTSCKHVSGVEFVDVHAFSWFSISLIYLSSQNSGADGLVISFLWWICDFCLSVVRRNNAQGCWAGVPLAVATGLWVQTACPNPVSGRLITWGERKPSADFRSTQAIQPSTLAVRTRQSSRLHCRGVAPRPSRWWTSVRWTETVWRFPFSWGYSAIQTRTTSQWSIDLTSRGATCLFKISWVFLFFSR